MNEAEWGGGGGGGGGCGMSTGNAYFLWIQNTAFVCEDKYPS